jgi:eukaryotic-like serine/threonine-protein kinase
MVLLIGAKSYAIIISLLLLLFSSYLFMHASFKHAYIHTAIASPSSNTYNTFLIYENAQYGFQIQYPSNWQKIEFSQGIERSGRNIVINFLSPSEGTADKFREYFIIEVGDLQSQQKLVSSSFSASQTSLLTHYINQQISLYKKLFHGFQLIESSSSDKNKGNSTTTTFSNIIYTYEDLTAGKVKIMESYFLKKDKIYLLSFHSEATNYEKYLPTIQKMVDSFHLTVTN